MNLWRLTAIFRPVLVFIYLLLLRASYKNDLSISSVHFDILPDFSLSTFLSGFMYFLLSYRKSKDPGNPIAPMHRAVGVLDDLAFNDFIFTLFVPALKEIFSVMSEPPGFYLLANSGCNLDRIYMFISVEISVIQVVRQCSEFNNKQICRAFLLWRFSVHSDAPCPHATNVPSAFTRHFLLHNSSVCLMICLLFIQFNPFQVCKCRFEKFRKLFRRVF